MVNNDLIGRMIGRLDWLMEERYIMEQGHMTRNDLLMLHTELTTCAKELMVAKNHDYASVDDPFRNFRLFGALGILVRLSDKLARLRSFLENGKLSVADESVRDTILDGINYNVLLMGMLIEQGGQPAKFSDYAEDWDSTYDATLEENNNDSTGFSHEAAPQSPCTDAHSPAQGEHHHSGCVDIR